ncbi:MAG: 4Fe-4S binding protein [Bacteroidaceae bacterium]|nr:4Fe-4S binding protein [Bacteroidaceae bacterium]
MLSFKTLRRIIALISFWAITLMFLDFTGTMHAWFSWLAKIQLLPAIYAANIAVLAVLFLLTLMFGRIYCSIICPLGIMQDSVAWLHRKIGKKHYTYSKEKKILRTVMFILFLAGCITAGMSTVVSLLEPYSIYGRTVSTLLQPLYIFANNGLAAIAERMDSYMFYSREVYATSAVLIAAVAIHIIIICVLAWRGGRTYCNTICPVGTILGFISPFSVIHVKFDKDKCKDCGKCVKSCKASCIDLKNHRVDESRCVMCGDCIEECGFDAISLGYHKINKKGSNTADSSEGMSRRAFLVGTALATSTAALAEAKIKVDGGLAKIEGKQLPKRNTPITPPGSLSADNLARNCTACQLCINECPNNVLRPSTDLETFMQPVVGFDHGYCRIECNRCSEVCPTSAIRPISKEARTAIQVGHAVVIKKNCLAAQGEAKCNNCAKHCPVEAIEMVAVNPDDPESPKMPAINETACIGCGACENLCPVRPFSAIYVEGHERHQDV